MSKLSSSILAADFANLQTECEKTVAGGADYIHVDIMDGAFVPELTFGPSVVRALGKVIHIPLDCHLMVMHPEKMINALCDYGASIITVHIESFCSEEMVHQTLKSIRDRGVRAGITLNPGTPVELIRPYLKEVSQVLVMTVVAGMGGQKLIPEMVERVRQVRQWLDEENPSCEIEIDGGVRQDNVRMLIQAGAEVIVAGSAVFSGDAESNTRSLKSIMTET